MALAIENVTLIDGTGAPARSGVTVLVESDRISRIARSSEGQAPSGVDTIDGRGKWLIPGLIDMHVHVALVGEEALPLWLGTGITTVRDLGGDIERLLPLRDAVAAGQSVGPRILSYGPMLDGTPSIFPMDAQSGFSRLTWLNASIEDGEASIDRLLAAGVDGIKLYAGLRPDFVAAMIHRVDGRLPVTGHLSRTWASEAIGSGINCLEHVHATVYQDVARPQHRHPREQGNGYIPNYWQWLNRGWAEADLSADYVRGFVDQIVANDVCLSPTTVLVTGGIATREAFEEPGLTYTTATQRRRQKEQAQRMAEMRADAEKAGRPIPAPQSPEPVIGQRALEHELALLRMVHEAGGVVTPSTDVGAAPNQVPGFSLHRELELFVRAGFTPLRAIHAATGQAAAVLRHSEIGTIREGNAADMVLLSADPLADIRNTRSIEAVIRAGRRFEPVALLEQSRTSER
jgi:imidazolonepropionase-like amidohydrolase